MNRYLQVFCWLGIVFSLSFTKNENKNTTGIFLDQATFSRDGNGNLRVTAEVMTTFESYHVVAWYENDSLPHTNPSIPALHPHGWTHSDNSAWDYMAYKDPVSSGLYHFLIPETNEFIGGGTEINNKIYVALIDDDSNDMSTIFSLSLVLP